MCGLFSSFFCIAAEINQSLTVINGVQFLKQISFVILILRILLQILHVLYVHLVVLAFPYQALEHVGYAERFSFEQVMSAIVITTGKVVNLGATDDFNTRRFFESLRVARDNLHEAIETLLVDNPDHVFPEEVHSACKLVDTLHGLALHWSRAQ